MLGKLMKYELKATARTFIPLYIAMFLVATVNRITRVSELNFGEGITAIVLGGLFIALTILTFVVLIQRFKNNLLGDEGYLMFTLPVKSYQLISSKLIINFVWGVLSIISAAITGLILMGDYDVLRGFFNDLGILWNGMIKYMADGYIMDVICGPIALVAGYASMVLSIYLALAAAQLPVFIKHRGIISFVAFFIEIVVLDLISSGVYKVIFAMSGVNIFENAISCTIWTLLIAVGLFCLVNYILKKHLNLE